MESAVALALRWPDLASVGCVALLLCGCLRSGHARSQGALLRVDGGPVGRVVVAVPRFRHGLRHSGLGCSRRWRATALGDGASHSLSRRLGDLLLAWDARTGGVGRESRGP